MLRGDELAQIGDRLAAAYGGRWDAKRMRTWDEALNPLPFPAILAATQRWIQNQRMPPRPSDIRELAVPKAVEAERAGGEKAFLCQACSDTGLVPTRLLAPEDHRFRGADYDGVRPCSCSAGKQKADVTAAHWSHNRCPPPIDIGPGNVIEQIVGDARASVEFWGGQPEASRPGRCGATCPHSRRCPDRVQAVRMIAPSFRCAYKLAWDEALSETSQ